MKLSTSFPYSLFERLVALILLASILPALLLIASLIHLTAGSPVFVTDELPNRDGTACRRSLRFRTTGRGATFFPIIGRYLRRTSMDEFPALWSIVCGHLRLGELLR